MLTIQPLHEHCDIFKSKDGQRDGETAEDYAERCEKYVVKFFTTMTPEMVRRVILDKIPVASWRLMKALLCSVHR